MYKDLVLKNRSYRRFHEHEKIEFSTLMELVDLARCSASAKNSQPLKYIISASEQNNNLIFPTLAWAGYYKDWDGPSEGEKPAAYIIILGDKNISPSFSCDHGIAAQTILLGATEKGFGGCMIASIQRDKLKAVLELKDRKSVV
jgi:nitroreductase